MGNKILILDDDADILEILKLLLTQSGYEVRTLNCGDTVFEDIKDFKPDLILMDVMLADLDGRTICKYIKENHLTNALPVILISANHDIADSIFFQGGPNDFIGKPFDIDELLDKIMTQFAA